MERIVLFNPDRHEPLEARPWSAGAARQTIGQIGGAAHATFSDKTLFPAHPMDEPSHAHMGSGHYYGASGVLWALDYLRREAATEVADATEPGQEVSEQWVIDSLTSLLERFEKEAAVRGPLAETTSLWFGDLPVLLQLLALTGADSWRTLALERVRSSTQDAVRELMWGTPGVLIATRLIADEQLAAAVEPYDKDNINKLVDAWDAPFGDLLLWNEELYGSRRLILGAVHGFFGQVLPLLQRLETLSEQQQAMVLERTRDVLCQTALQEPGLANWPVMLGEPGVGREPLLHYCHGAPGVVISTCDFPAGIDSEVDQLLLDGGELVWRAGPLRKGSNLCHGTAGSGYTCLKLFARTADQLWLDRARQLAMHGIAQYRQALAETGQSRFSLWTGDAGFAVFLAACLRADARLPTVDVF